MHDDKFGRYFGWYCSTYLTHAGQHDVNWGSRSRLPDDSLSRNSAVSSTTVRSAVKQVSKTMSTPMLLSAATTLPGSAQPGSCPNSSPSATRIAGATCATTLMFGS
ncbi:MAG: hypothetical protein BWY92_01843 [Firmicutes bacterium ADurb.BinA052]|nr:MAG: hypothetical protein BWY92_01843 [Firmicutes bacterium ADurb.BinA052]